MIGLEPISLRVSLTERCTLRCRYCRPVGETDMPPTATMSAAAWLRRIAALCRSVSVSKIRFTGGEPLLYPELDAVIAGCASLGIPDLALTTNGLQLAARAAALRAHGLQRVNVSLDSVDPEVFQSITGGPLGPVLAGIDAALAAGLAVKLNALILRGVNEDDGPALLDFAAHRGMDIRFLERMPIGPAADGFEETSRSGREIMKRLTEAGIAFEKRPHVRGETSCDYLARLPGGRSVICGFILPMSDPFCDGCRRLRLRADGRLVGCLARPEAADMEAALAAAEAGEPAPLRTMLDEAFAIKRRPHRFREQRAPVAIGG